MVAVLAHWKETKVRRQERGVDQRREFAGVVGAYGIPGLGQAVRASGGRLGEGVGWAGGGAFARKVRRSPARRD